MTTEQMINTFERLAGQIVSESSERNAAISKACMENLWFTPENCVKALDYWAAQLKSEVLMPFVSGYEVAISPKRVGIIMAGNIPLVGMHDLVCCLLSGHKAVVKLSSEDTALMQFVIEQLLTIDKRFGERIEIIERLDTTLDAVIATGSNNSFRYFEQYFGNIPHILRKNRKSVAVLNGNESENELKGIAADVFDYFGLGCRNVSLIFIPEGVKIERIIDHFEGFSEVLNNNRYANNYTYHKALYLMNQQEHLDNGFVLIKRERSLKAPLGCIYYDHYKNQNELRTYLSTLENELQMICGAPELGATVDYGQGQNPQLQDFADDINSLDFLAEL